MNLFCIKGRVSHHWDLESRWCIDCGRVRADGHTGHGGCCKAHTIGEVPARSWRDVTQPTRSAAA